MGWGVGTFDPDRYFLYLNPVDGIFNDTTPPSLHVFRELHAGSLSISN
ncbi:MAG: hypothetical protein BMS9Abin05_2373 [Rhodothermia bacterium]|nr:MAG: hypothetical protein BMS9Abin05_2373 [Rhodothermia bacterium]